MPNTTTETTVYNKQSAKINAQHNDFGIKVTNYYCKLYQYSSQNSPKKPDFGYGMLIY